MSKIEKLFKAIETYVNRLDTKDGKKDGQIQASIWNAFAQDKGGAHIDGFISNTDAKISIMLYLSRESEKTGEDKGDIAYRWGISYDDTSVEKGTRKAVEEDIRKAVEVEFSKRKLQYNQDDINYWTKLISDTADKCGVRPEILVAIIGQEVHFDKNPGASHNGTGIMQVTSVLIKDMAPEGKGSRGQLYRQLDSKLYDEIFSKNNFEGKEYNGKDMVSKVKYKCSIDNAYCAKVGILAFKFRYAEAISRKKGISLAQAIQQVAEGETELTGKENKSVIELAARNYNSNTSIDKNGKKVCDNYGANVTDSLTNYPHFSYEYEVFSKIS